MREQIHKSRVENKEQLTRAYVVDGHFDRKILVRRDDLCVTFDREFSRFAAGLKEREQACKKVKRSRTSRFLGLTNLDAGAELAAAMMPIGTALHEPVLTAGEHPGPSQQALSSVGSDRVDLTLVPVRERLLPDGKNVKTQALCSQIALGHSDDPPDRCGSSKS